MGSKIKIYYGNYTIYNFPPQIHEMDYRFITGLTYYVTVQTTR